MLRREDLATLGDYLVTGRRFGHASEGPLCDLDDLVAAVHRNTGRRGLRGARWAVDLIRVGPASRPESLLRLLIVAAGLPEPEISPAVVVARGTIVLHPDLAYPDLRIAIEYEGSSHRDADRWERDIERRELFEDAGWRVIRVTKQGLFTEPEATVRRIRHARIARASL